MERGQSPPGAGLFTWRRRLAGLDASGAAPGRRPRERRRCPSE